MPKILHMPKRHVPTDLVIGLQGHSIPDPVEESESISKIQRWLEMADSALENAAPLKKPKQSA